MLTFWICMMSNVCMISPPSHYGAEVWRKDLLIIHPCGANSACEINLPCRSKIILCSVVVFISFIWSIVVCGVYFALWVELQIAASVACKLLSWVVFLLLCGFVGHVKIHGRSDASYSWPGPVIGMCYQVTDWCGFGVFLTNSLIFSAVFYLKLG